MKIIKERTPDPKYFCKAAKEIKEGDINIRLAHTRKAKELNLAKDCKIITEKKLTKSQEVLYNTILDEERGKNEGHLRRLKKREKIVKKKKEII